MRHTLEKISSLILKSVPFVIGLIVPLIFSPLTSDQFTITKYYFIALIASISLLAWCFRNLAKGKLHFTLSPALFPLFILIVANLVSSLWISQTKHNSLWGQTGLITCLGIIFTTVTSSQKNRGVISSTILGLISSASFLSLFTVLNHFGLIGKISWLKDISAQNPAGGLLPALSFTLPIIAGTIAYATRQKNWTVKSALLSLSLLMATASIINLSLIFPPKSSPTVVTLPLKAGWSIAVDTLKSWPTALFGNGPESFFTTYTRLKPVYLNQDPLVWNLRFSDSSNHFLTLLTTIGVLGALAFLAFFLRPLVCALRQRSAVADPNRTFILVSLCVTLAQIFLIPLGIVTLTLAFLLTALLTINAKVNEDRSVKDVLLGLSANSETNTVLSLALPIITLIISLGLIVTFWIFASRTYSAAVNYKRGNTLVQTDPNQAFISFQKATQQDPFNPFYPQTISKIYLAVSTSYLSKENSTDEDKRAGTDYAQRAIDAAKIAVKADPLNVIGWENLTSVYTSLIPYSQGAADLAISHNLQTIALDPVNPSAYLRIGVLFYNLGDSSQAVKFFERSLELKSNWDLPYYNLSSIYKNQKDYTKALQYARAGVQYTNPNDRDLNTIQEEIKALEKLLPAPSATDSATNI